MFNKLNCRIVLNNRNIELKEWLITINSITVIRQLTEPETENKLKWTI